MSNPHSVISECPSMIYVRHCAECDTPLIEVPLGERGWYCVHCLFFPSMQDTYLRKTKVYDDNGHN